MVVGGFHNIFYFVCCCLVYPLAWPFARTFIMVVIIAIVVVFVTKYSCRWTCQFRPVIRVYSPQIAIVPFAIFLDLVVN